MQESRNKEDLLEESAVALQDPPLEERADLEEVVAERETGFAQAEPAPQKRRRRRKKAPFIIGGILLLLVIAVVWKFTADKAKKPTDEVLNDVVSRGSISSMVEGGGVVKAKTSEAISVGVAGTVVDVYVSEGQAVAAGTVLYLIDSPGADEAVSKAQKEVDEYQKQLKRLNEAKANLNVRPQFAGKILEVAKVKTGDKVTDGQVLARLVEDSKMKLTQYYSYAYEGDVYIGQSVQVSVPGVMQQLDGKITQINKVERISAEGAKLFAAEISLDNPGVLSEKMPASAVIYTGGETISPYEQGALEFNRVEDFRSKVNGEVKTIKLQEHLKVTPDQVLVTVSGDDTDGEIFRIQESLKSAQETLDTAQKNKQNLQASATIDGTVVGLTIKPGDTVTAGTAVISIMDLSQLVIEADIDERSVSYVKAGMMAELDQFGQMTTGLVESVGLNGKFENGMSSFPAIISVDNSSGTLQNNSSITYKIQASQSDDCLLLPSQCVKSVADPETGEPLDAVFVKASTAPEGSLVIDGTSLGVPATGYFAVPVEIGIADKYNVEILSGVEEGTEVFTQVVRQSSMGMMGY